MMVATTNNCDIYKGGFCDHYQNNSVYFDTCNRHEKDALLMTDNLPLVCQMLSSVLFLSTYCHVTHNATTTTDNEYCIRAFRMSLIICSSAYTDNNADFSKCFEFFAGHTDLTKIFDDTTPSERFWNTLDRICFKANASKLTVCASHVRLMNNVFNFTFYMKSEAQILYFKFIHLTLTVIVLFFNVVFISALRRSRIAAPCKALLICISIVDIISPLSCAPILFYFTHLDTIYDFIPYSLCIYTIIMINDIPRLFHSISLWLNLGLASQRYLAIGHPFMANKSIFKNSIRLPIVYTVCVIIALTALYVPGMVQMHTFFPVEVASKLDVSKTIKTAIVVLNNEEKLGDSYFIAVIFICNIIPVVLLTSVSVLLKVNITKHMSTQNALRTTQNENPLTVISRCVLCISVCTVFTEACNVIISLFTFPGLDFFSFLTYMSVSANVFTLINCEINVLICCCVGEEIRNIIKSMFTPCCK